MAGKVGAGLPHSKKTPARMPALQLEIEGTLLMRVLAVAALDNLEAWAVEAQRALRHEQDALLIVFAKAASWSQARAAVQFGRHGRFFTIPLRVGRRRGAASRD